MIRKMMIALATVAVVATGTTFGAMAAHGGGMGHGGFGGGMGHGGFGHSGFGGGGSFGHAAFGHPGGFGGFSGGRPFGFRGDRFVGRDGHRFFRNRFAFIGAPFLYGDDYDDCYTRVWTRWGWRWTSVC